jgi:hypothetical protein
MVAAAVILDLSISALAAPADPQIAGRRVLRVLTYASTPI